MDFLEIAGKSLPISFGYGALMEYETATGKSAVQIVEAGASIGFTEILTLIACGLTNGADAANDPREYTAKGVARMLDETPDSPAVLQKAMLLLQKSFATTEQKKTVKLQPTQTGARRKAG